MAGDDNFDYKTAWLDLHKENALAISNAAYSTQRAHFSAIIDYSKIAINGAFLLNGMAGIAVFSNLEKLGSAGLGALMGCAWGAVFAVVCAGVSYLGQRAYSSVFDENIKREISFYFSSIQKVMRDNASLEGRPEAQTATLGNCLSFIACATWCASIGCFLWAIYCSFPSL